LKTHGTHGTPSADDCHLRSSNTVIGYHIEATDGDIGHLEDLVVDDYTWAIRYLIVNTSNWWGGRRVLVAPECIDNVSWSEAKVSINLTRQAIKDAPPHDSAAQLDRRGEEDSTTIPPALGIGASRPPGAVRRAAPLTRFASQPGPDIIGRAHSTKWNGTRSSTIATRRTR
jgi:hypothetical protein